MHNEALLNQVGELIKTAQGKGAIRAHLCWWKEKLQILPANHTEEPHDVFIRFRNLSYWTGLSSPDWDQLEARLQNFLKEVKK